MVPSQVAVGIVTQLRRYLVLKCKRNKLAARVLHPKTLLVSHKTCDPVFTVVCL